jgi:hypothetical protein
MADNLSKIDTQGLSGPATPEQIAKAKQGKHKPMMVKPRRIHTPEIVKELKILINEVLDEREGKMDYQSYFDLDGREYPVE